MTSSTGQFLVQVTAAAVAGWALGKLLVELLAGGVGMAWRRLRRGPA
jgi:hypothetical protein